tara:strand:+ start:347 stop:505 length:159 start_codon:yes stop_codon:yes gene_type:complete
MNNLILKATGIAIITLSLRYFFINFLKFTNDEDVFALIIIAIIVIILEKLFE